MRKKWTCAPAVQCMAHTPNTSLLRPVTNNVALITYPKYNTPEHVPCHRLLLIQTNWRELNMAKIRCAAWRKSLASSHAATQAWQEMADITAPPCLLSAVPDYACLHALLTRTQLSGGDDCNVPWVEMWKGERAPPVTTHTFRSSRM